MTEKVKGSVDRCIAVENMLDDMGRNISKDIYAAVRRATSNVVKGDVRRSGQGVTSGNAATGSETVLGEAGRDGPPSEHIRHLIALKADQTELEKLTMSKANKVDTDMCLKWLELMHMQLK